MRNAQKDIDEYKSKYWVDNKSNAGAFYWDDIKQIHDISKDLFGAINNAMMFGFMVGYRRAKREMKKR